jgi:hypothetical protein
VADAGIVRLMKLRVLAGAFVVLALASGCGASSNSVTAKFKADYNQLRGPMNQTGSELGAEVQKAPKQTDAQVGAAFRSIANRFQSELSQLQTLKPPASVQADWNSVIAAAQRLENDMGDIVAAAATHSASSAEQAGARLAVDAQALQSSLKPVKSKLGLK